MCKKANIAPRRQVREIESDKASNHASRGKRRSVYSTTTKRRDQEEVTELPDRGNLTNIEDHYWKSMKLEAVISAI